MKNLYKYMLIAGVLFSTYSCKDDDLDPNGIFDTNAPVRNEFDTWILDSLTKPYNISIDYLYDDNETNLTENVVPAKISQSIALAKLVKHVWLDAYTEVAGKDFLKEHCFRQFTFIGSGQYTRQGTVVMGQADSGIKVILFRLNDFDPDNIYINTTNYYRNNSSNPMDMNYWYFGTIHHEFCHILTQIKSYSTKFQLISAGDYSGPNWNNVSEREAGSRGFVSAYATKEYNEDFAETYAMYVTSTDKMWNQLLNQATAYLTDENNNPVYVLDKSGNPIPQLDDDGNPIYKRVATYLVPETTADGDTVYAKDAAGKSVYALDADSQRIVRCVEHGTKFKYKPDADGRIVVYYYLNKKWVEVTNNSDYTPMVLTVNGDTVYSKDGSPVYQYIQLPNFQCQYEQMTDESKKNLILQKVEIIRDYFKKEWNVDIDELRKKILERTSEESIKSLNLKSLKD